VARRRAGRSPKTVNNEILVLRAVLKRSNLWSSIQPDYKPLKVPKKGPGVAITAEQAARLFSVSNAKPGWFVGLRAGLLAYSTGSRTKEIRTLQLGDLSLSAYHAHSTREHEKRRRCSRGRPERTGGVGSFGATSSCDGTGRIARD
jgi:hypothetical protein